MGLLVFVRLCESCSLVLACSFFLCVWIFVWIALRARGSTKFPHAFRYLLPSSFHSARTTSVSFVFEGFAATARLYRAAPCRLLLGFLTLLPGSGPCSGLGRGCCCCRGRASGFGPPAARLPLPCCCLFLKGLLLDSHWLILWPLWLKV